MEHIIECPNKDYDLILKEYKEIPLTQGKVALVDINNYEYLNQWKWCAYKSRNIYYAVRHKNYHNAIMHREIIKPPKGMQIDHINRNGLDNRKDNLRMCNYSQNQMNTNKPITNSSGYKGVDKIKIGRKKWRVRMCVNKKYIHIGCFSTQGEAVLAYNAAIKKYHGEFANTARQ